MEVDARQSLNAWFISCWLQRDGERAQNEGKGSAIAASKVGYPSISRIGESFLEGDLPSAAMLQTRFSD